MLVVMHATPGAYWHFVLVCVLLLIITCNRPVFGTEDKQFFQRAGVQASEIIRARGYSAIDYQMITDDGYVLGITRANNPLISRRTTYKQLNRDPILFVHGSLVEANCFVTNSFDVKHPQDWTRVNVRNYTENELIDMLKDEPASKSLPFLAMNFGHEVWFLHKRGAKSSQMRVSNLIMNKNNRSWLPSVMDKYRQVLSGQSNNAEELSTKRRVVKRNHIIEVEDLNNTPLRRSLKYFDGKNSNRGKKLRGTKSTLLAALESAPAALLDYGNFLDDIRVTLDRHLWNHSLDEQAAYDVPNAVDYVLEHTGRDKLMLLGDSSGGALVIMSLILDQSLNHKLSKAVAWAPSFNIGHVKGNQNFTWAQPFLRYTGPYPFTFLSFPVQAFMEILCSLEIMQVTICPMMLDLNWGKSLGRAPIRAEYHSDNFVPVSAFEYLQLAQWHTRKQSHFFDHDNKLKNILAYGQSDPPIYNVSLIQFKHLTIWSSTYDDLVTEADIESITSQMRVPVRAYLITDKGLNHGAFLFHKDVAKSVVIPTYKDMITYNSRTEHRGRQRRGKSKRELARR